MRAILPLLLFCALGVAQGSYLTKLPDHPNLAIEVSVPVKTSEGTFLRRCQISWNRVDGKTTFSTKVNKAEFPKVGPKGYAEGLPFIKADRETAPVVEIFELAKAVEAELPKFNAPTPPAPAESRFYSMRLDQGGDDVWWEVRVLPGSKLAGAMQKLYGKISEQLSDEQKAELDKTRKPEPPRSNENSEPKLYVESLFRGYEGDLGVDRRFEIAFTASKEKKCEAQANFECRDEPKAGEVVKIGEERAHKNEAAEDDLDKWPLADVARILATHDREAHLLGSLPRPYNPRSTWRCISRGNGDGRMFSDTYNDCAPSRIAGWSNANNEMKKLLSPKLLKVVDTPAKLP